MILSLMLKHLVLFTFGDIGFCGIAFGAISGGAIAFLQFSNERVRRLLTTCTSFLNDTQ